MTPSEQIEWIRADVSEFCMTRCRDRPQLVYLVAPADCHSIQTHVLGHDSHAFGSLELSTAAGHVLVHADRNKPAGLAPTRCYRCSCGALFADDSSRSGKCAGCMMADVAKTVAEHEERERTAFRMLRLDQPEICPVCCRSPRLTAANGGMQACSDPECSAAHGYAAPPPIPPEGHARRAWSAGRRGKSEHIRQQVMSRVNAGESVGVATPSGIVDGREWLSKWRATPPARPDGFDQGRIDQIKAMLLAKSKP